MNIYLLLESQVESGWGGFLLFMLMVRGEWPKKKKKSPANTPQLCHPIYHSDFCLWEAFSLNFSLIFFKRERWVRHCQQTKAELCCWCLPLPWAACTSFPPLLCCTKAEILVCRVNPLSPGNDSNVFHQCWIKERLLCLGVLLQHFVSLNVRPQGLIREKLMAHAFLLSFYLFSRGWFPFSHPP